MAVDLCIFPTNWGWMGVAISERGLAGLILPRPSQEATWALLEKAHPAGRHVEGDPWPELRQKLLDYLAGQIPDFSDIPLDLPPGPPFWRRVWDRCARIPYGETATYLGLAKEVGSPRAFRAVGSAMAANPIPIIIPCHRVVGSDGSLTGFGGGLDQKKRLLAMEAASRSA